MGCILLPSQSQLLHVSAADSVQDWDRGRLVIVCFSPPTVSDNMIFIFIKYLNIAFCLTFPRHQYLAEAVMSSLNLRAEIQLGV